MGVRREEYIIVGIKLDEDFTSNKMFDNEEMYKYEFDNNENSKDKECFLVDGMNGDYTFFGLINQIGDGWEENYEIIELNEPTIEQKERIVTKFKELFPDTEVPEVKVYFVPHYT